MDRPVVSEVAEELYSIISPLAFEDEENDWALLIFCEALIGAVQIVREYSIPFWQGVRADINWQTILSIDDTRGEALRWLAQFVGVVIVPQLVLENDNDLRDYIKSLPGFTRGSPNAMRAEISRFLTGNKTVIFRERYGGAYKLEVRTYTSETPDSAKVLSAIISQKPAGISLNYQALAGQEWQQLFTNYPTWNDVYNTYHDWQDVVEDTP
jgi:hypothetical protein